MQRQSLGSPGSKHHHHHHHHSSSPVAVADDDDVEKRRRRSKSGASPSGPDVPLEEDDIDERKLDKAVRLSTEKSIHLIPLLTFLCFLVLYLFSHDPSPKDMEAFEGFGGGVDSRGTTSATGAGRLMEAAAEAGTMRSNRRLKELRGGGGRKLGAGRRR